MAKERILNVLNRSEEFQMFAVNPKFRNRRDLFDITRCSIDSDLHQSIKSSNFDNVHAMLELEVVQYSPHSNISSTTNVCSIDRFEIREKVNYLLNSVNRKGWEKSQFLKSKYFITEYLHEGEKLTVLSKCPAGWSLKGKFTLNLLDNGLLKKVNSNPILYNDRPDFVLFGENVYINSCSVFEQFFQIQEGLMHQADSFASEDIIQERFVNVDELVTLAKSNKRYLNLLSDAFQKKKYTSPNFWEKVIQKNETENWGLNFTHDGKIVFDEAKMKDYLFILKDGKVASLITDERYNMEREEVF